MADRAARVVAQGKINLFLNVGELQADGFHEIETLFQRIELGDDVVVRASDTGAREIVCRGLAGVASHENIAFRAAELYAARTGWPNGFSIDIEKRIPAGGGLGGGSADAAAVLRLLNFLSPEPVTSADLLDFAGELGSDVPFLASDSSLSLAEGRGEIMLALKPLPVRGVTLFRMPFGVDTGAAYGWLDAERLARPEPPRRGAAPKVVNSWSDVLYLANNDFEQVVSDRHPSLAVLLASARSGDYEMAEMSGSGSTAFAISFGEEPLLAPDYIAGDAEQLLTRTAVAVAQPERG